MNETENLYRKTFEKLCSKEGRSVFFQNVEKSFIIGNSPFSQSFGDNFQKLLESRNKDIPSSDGVNIFANTNISLENIYLERSKSAKMLLISSLVSISIFITLVIFIVLKSSFSSTLNTDSIGLINIILTAVPVLLGGGLFVLYNKENDKLDKVEQDIRLLNRMIGVLSIINTITDDILKKQVLENFLKTING